MHKNKIVKAISKFQDIKVLVIGDIILDQFLRGTARCISPEAPVPIVDVEDAKTMLGGAANVLENVCNLSGRGLLCGAIGDDVTGDEVLDLINDLDSSTEAIFKMFGYSTSTKVRVIAQNQQVVRFDREEILPPSRELLYWVSGVIRSEKADVVIISDYTKGLITNELMDLVNFNGCPVILDTKSRNIDYVGKASIITSNKREIEWMVGRDLKSDLDYHIAGKLIFSHGCDSVLITKGSEGMTLLENDQPIVHIPSKVQEVYDVSGAGDTVTALMALGVGSGLSHRESAELANIAAGIVVGKVGTATVTKEELIANL